MKHASALRSNTTPINKKFDVLKKNCKVEERRITNGGLGAFESSQTYSALAPILSRMRKAVGHCIAVLDPSTGPNARLVQENPNALDMIVSDDNISVPFPSSSAAVEIAIGKL